MGLGQALLCSKVMELNNASVGGEWGKVICMLTAWNHLHHALLYHLHIGEALNIDPRQFYVQLYEALLQLDTGRYVPTAYSTHLEVPFSVVQ